MDEEWRDIEEFKGIYQVSNLGRVRSVERYINTRTYPAQIIKPFVGNNGCIMVQLRQKNKGQMKRSVAKLVLLAFVGEPPGTARGARHIDGDQNNNYVGNLEWDVCKAYYMPENDYARSLFAKKAEKMVDIYITTNRLRKAVNFFYCDADDFKQMCLFKIWKYIDAYTSDINFYTFCRVKCDDVYRSLYKKERKKADMITRFEDMATEKKPLDSMIELSYTEDFEVDNYEI